MSVKKTCRDGTRQIRHKQKKVPILEKTKECVNSYKAFYLHNVQESLYIDL